MEKIDLRKYTLVGMVTGTLKQVKSELAKRKKSNAEYEFVAVPDDVGTGAKEYFKNIKKQDYIFSYKIYSARKKAILVKAIKR